MTKIRFRHFAALAAGLLFCGKAHAQELSMADWKVAEREANAGAESSTAREALRKMRQDVATALLHKAVKAMEGRVWRVDGSIEEQVMPMMTQQWGVWHASGSIRGLVSATGFDFTGHGSPVGNLRRIAIHGTEWTSVDEGKTWTVKQPDSSSFPNAPSLENWMIGVPLPIQTRWHFEPAGTEQHEDGAWAHIRAVDSPGRLECWILLDANGGPVSVRRIVSRSVDPAILAMREAAYLFTLDLTAAKDEEKIEPPAAK